MKGLIVTVFDIPDNFIVTLVRDDGAGSPIELKVIIPPDSITIWPWISFRFRSVDVDPSFNSLKE